MAKLSLTDLASIEGNEATAISAINANNAAIETALENTLSRDGTSPNDMLADLDMGGFTIYNLPSPTLDSEPATKGYVDDLAALDDAPALAQAVTDAQTAASAAAASAVTAAAAAASFTATSATSLTPAVASKVFTIQASKAYTAGMWVLARSDAAPTTVWMFGQVTSYVGTTLTVDVQVIGTATLSADWTITVSGIRGAAGAAGAAGADYTADAELNALAGLTATPGLMTQTADNVFTTRTITGTANKITVTDGDGVAGNPTLTVGDDVLQTNVTKTMTVGMTHTPYDHGTQTGVISVSPLPSLGLLQTAALDAASTVTINAPTTESGVFILQLTNSGVPTSVSFSGFDKTLLGDTFSLTINKIHWIYIWSIGTAQVMQIVAIN